MAPAPLPLSLGADEHSNPAWDALKHQMLLTEGTCGFGLSSVKQTEVSLEDNYRFSVKMIVLNPARWYLSHWSEYKKRIQATGSLQEGPFLG